MEVVLLCLVELLKIHLGYKFEGTLRAIGDTAVSITIEDAAVEHLSLWKPKNTTTYTHAQYWNHFGSGEPTEDATYTVTTLHIPEEILV